LKNTWNKAISDKKNISKHALFKACLWSYKWQYMITMILTITSSILSLSSPFLIKPLIQYIKTGENVWSEQYGIEFFDFTGNKYLEWIKQDMQYGICLALMFVLSQGFGYLVTENISFRQTMVGSKSANALIGLIYEK